MDQKSVTSMLVTDVSNEMCLTKCFGDKSEMLMTVLAIFVTKIQYLLKLKTHMTAKFQMRSDCQESYVNDYYAFVWLIPCNTTCVGKNDHVI